MPPDTTPHRQAMPEQKPLPRAVPTVHFSEMSHVIIFMEHLSVAENRAMPVHQVKTQRSCCHSQISGNLQDEHLICQRHRDAVSGTGLAEQEEDDTAHPSPDRPFESVMDDIAGEMSLSQRLLAYGKIVRFQVSQQRCAEESGVNCAQKKTRLAACITTLLKQAHNMTVYPFAAYYLPLLLFSEAKNTAINPSRLFLAKEALPYLAPFTHNNLAAQRFLLRGLEDYPHWLDPALSGTCQQQPQKKAAARRICDTLHQLYLHDILDKLAILTWYDDSTHTGIGLQGAQTVQVYANLPHCFCRDNASTPQDFARATRFRHLASPFICWLKSVGDDDSDSELT